LAGAGAGAAFSGVVSRAALTLYLLSTDDFVADTARFGALQGTIGKLRSAFAQPATGYGDAAQTRIAAPI